MLLFVSLFLKAMEKCASSMEDIVNSCQVGDDSVRELDEHLSYIQIQYSCPSSIDKALKIVIDASITMTYNLQLARRNTTLKQCAPHLHENDRNRLRRLGFMSSDLFPRHLECHGEER